MGALNDQQKKELYSAGFLVSEIARFNAATTPDGDKFQDLAFTSKPFQAMIKRRKRAYDGEKKKGLTSLQIRRKFQRALRIKNGPSPWDFLKAEYMPPKKTGDYVTKVDQLKARIEKRMPGYYKLPQVKPKYQPIKKPMPKRRSK